MFDNLFGGQEEQPTGVDALLKLLDREDIDLKTDLEIKQIKVLVMARWYYLIQDREKSALECLNQCFEYYKELKASYKRKSRTEIIKGISEMKELLMQSQLMKDQEVVK